MKSCILFLIDHLKSKGYRVEIVPSFVAENNLQQKGVYLRIDWGTRNQSNSDKEYFKRKAKELLKKHPNSNRVEFIYKK